MPFLCKLIFNELIINSFLSQYYSFNNSNTVDYKKQGIMLHIPDVKRFVKINRVSKKLLICHFKLNFLLYIVSSQIKTGNT